VDRWTILAKCIESAGMWSVWIEEPVSARYSCSPMGKGEKESDFADRRTGGWGGQGGQDGSGPQERPGYSRAFG